jgi:hypothetical protein
MTLATLLLLLQTATSPCLDINTASTAQLMTLEGVTPEIAESIIKGRPYKFTLLIWNMMPKEVWEKNMSKFCIQRGGGSVQVIRGNKIDSLKFEQNERTETKPSEEKQPETKEPPKPVEVLPAEVLDERLGKLSEEVEKEVEAPPLHRP